MIGVIDNQPFLQDPAELIVKLPVLLGLILRQPIKPIEHALDDRGAHFPDDAVVLQGLSRDIQRQIFGINQSPQESQILWQKLTAVALHQHALGTETEPMI